MKLNEYQYQAISTAIYPKEQGLVYCALKLNGEAGEVAEKIGKSIRDNNGNLSEGDREALILELGDVLWYIANLAGELNINLDAVAHRNLDKLQSRRRRGVLSGSGDSR